MFKVYNNILKHHGLNMPEAEQIITVNRKWDVTFTLSA